MSKNNYNELRKLIDHYTEMYEFGLSPISDSEFDKLKAKLKGMNPNYKRIGYLPQYGKTITHEQPILSLDHGIENQALEFFLNKHREYSAYVCEHKIDGVSVVLTYKNGQLKHAVTRGNGYKGYDVTHHLEHVVLNSISVLSSIVIRGEIYVEHKDFLNYHADFTSPRNMAAGILHSKTYHDGISSIKFVGFQILNKSFAHYYEEISLLRKIGFQTPHSQLTDHNGALKYFDQVKVDRPNLPYVIDGIVCKINDKKAWDSLGCHSTAPRYAMAIKFKPQFTEATILDIAMQVGKAGSITPIAIIQPVLINGKKITRISLHNYSHLIAKQYNIGDIINVYLSGEAVPHAGDIVKKSSDTNISIILKKCPSCSALLVNYKCTNGWLCKEQKIHRLTHFTSRNAFNIIGLGLQNITKLVEYGYVNNPADIFYLPHKILTSQIRLDQHPGWNAKSIQVLISNIKLKKNVSFAQLLFSLSIEGLGLTQARNIAKLLKHWHSLVNIMQDPARTIEGIQPRLQSNMRSFFISPPIWLKELIKQICIH